MVKLILEKGKSATTNLFINDVKLPVFTRNKHIFNIKYHKRDYILKNKENLIKNRKCNFQFYEMIIILRVVYLTVNCLLID